MKCLLAFLAIVAVGLNASAASVAGDWRGTVSTPKGEYPISFSFTVDAGRLNGTMLGTDGTPFTIENGRIDGDIITFAVTLNYPGKSIPRTYKGTLSGDEIKFTVDSSGQTSEFVVKRVK